MVVEIVDVDVDVEDVVVVVTGEGREKMPSEGNGCHQCLL